MTAEELSHDEELPPRYIESILVDLRRAGILANRRGRDPGYYFEISPEKVTPADVMRALEGPLAEVRGLRPEATSYTGSSAALQGLWIALRANIRLVLEGVSLAELARGEFPDPIARLIEDPDSWLKH
jgi:Rrf2 family protein